jgi:hypothetical protein
LLVSIFTGSPRNLTAFGLGGDEVGRLLGENKSRAKQHYSEGAQDH